MLSSAHGETFEMAETLRQLDGADLQCWDLTISMSSLNFKILGLTSEVAYLYFGSPDYLDLPFVMHDVRLRLATPQSMYVLCERLNVKADLIARWEPKRPWEEVVHITCLEGEFFVAAGMTGIHVGAIPSFESLERIKLALQYCGVDPTAEDFWVLRT